MGLKERRQREKDEVRLKIMNAARELFAAHGVEAVSMRKIAEAMEYSPTITYQHFADKESLLHEICREDFGALAGVFGEIANVADPLKRIEQIGLAYARFGLEYPNHYRLMFMTAHRDENPECGKGDPDEDGYAFLRKSVSEAVAAGKYRDGLDDADLISQVLWSAVHGLVSLQITKGNDPWLEWRPFEKRIRLMLESLQRGMERKGKKS
jgi:AcrR family transcriptional regulator